MKYLKKLILNNNKLNSLPEWIVELENLEILLLNDNHFETFPVVFMKLKKLSTFQIDRNPGLKIQVGARTLPYDEGSTLKHLGVLLNPDHSLWIGTVLKSRYIVPLDGEKVEQLQ